MTFEKPYKGVLVITIQMPELPAYVVPLNKSFNCSVGVIQWLTMTPYFWQVTNRAHLES